MKYLSDYMEEAQTKLFEEYGVFFAFSTTQFNEAKNEDVEYVLIATGMFCPKDNAEFVTNELKNIYKEAIKKDLEENGSEKIIKRELANYECYYTGDIDDAVSALADYNISEAQIHQVFCKG